MTGPATEGAEGAPPPATDSFEPKTAEAIDLDIAQAEWTQDLQLVLKTVQEVLGEVSKIKLKAKLLPAGGLSTHLNKLRDEMTQHRARLEILRGLWLDLQGQKPLPDPPNIRVVRKLPE